jgi:hypothetical protein
MAFGTTVAAAVKFVPFLFLRRKHFGLCPALRRH